MWVASFPGLVVRSENEVCTMSWDVLIASFPGLVVRSETPGEGQFGQVWEALAVGICPDHSRNVVAVKTLKRETHYPVFTTKKHTTP